jgi:hypothetical protein
VKFVVTKGTTQTTCLRLMGKKMLVALMMEGKFSGEGIHSLESDDDMMSAMARELVERGRVGESADAVWADLKHERALHMPARPALDPEQDTDAGISREMPEMPLFLPHSTSDPQPALTLVHPIGQPKHKLSSLWPTGHDEGAQLLLFA